MSGNQRKVQFEGLYFAHPGEPPVRRLAGLARHSRTHHLVHTNM